MQGALKPVGNEKKKKIIFENGLFLFLFLFFIIIIIIFFFLKCFILFLFLIFFTILLFLLFFNTVEERLYYFIFLYLFLTKNNKINKNK